MIKIFILTIAISFFYLFIKKPYVLTAILMFMLLYGFNLKLPFLFDLRGLLLIGMIGRLLFEEENQKFIAKFLLTDKYFYLLLCFIFYSLAILLARFYGTDELLLIKNNLILIGSLLLGFLVGINPKGKNVFIIAIITSGLFAALDLFYTYKVYGDNSPVRVLNVIFYNDTTSINYNYHGMLLGISLVYSLLLFFRKQISKYIFFLLMLVFTLGIVLTTSRGAIFAIIIVFIIMKITQKEIKFGLKKIITGLVALIFFFFAFYLIYNSILSQVNKSVLIDNIYWRLYQEPLSLFGVDVEGHDYSVNVKYGTMSQRYEKSSGDIEKFFKSSIIDQTFGLGEDGYIIEKYSSDKWGNAHNGYVLILIERGIIGFILFTGVLLFIILESLKISRNSSLNTPIVYLLIFLGVYAVSHNAEITSSLSFIIFGGIIGNNKDTVMNRRRLSKFITEKIIEADNMEKEVPRLAGKHSPESKTVIKV